MASRETFSDLTPPPLPGGGASGLMRQYSERFKTLFDASALPLTAVGGTANAVTATLDPPLDSGGLVDGMKFTLTWAADNTAGVTLAINGGSALAVVDAAGTALAAGAVTSGLRSQLEYIGGSFRVLSTIRDAAAASSFYFAFTSSDTFTKPAGLDDDRIITIEAWGAGGGGVSTAQGPGGAGGSYVMRRVRAADVPSSVSVTIGSGGAVNASGGSSSFGSLVTAYGGRTGANSAGGGGGGGGGELAAGAAGSGSDGGSGGVANGGKGGNGANNAPAQAGGSSFWGGGGGGGGSFGTTGTRSGGSGGSSVFGGAGGAGEGISGNGSGGQSLYGGNGGNVGVAGSAPGGGGGRNAAGARGEVRVWI